MDYQNNNQGVNKKGNGLIIFIVLALIIVLGVIFVVPFISYLKIINNVRQSLAEDVAYGIIKSVELAKSSFLLENSDKEIISLEDMKDSYYGDNTTWNEDNTITSEHYDFICNVTINKNNEMVVSCDVNGKIIKSDPISLKVETDNENKDDTTQNNQTNNNNSDSSSSENTNSILSSDNVCVNNNTKCANGTLVNVKVNSIQTYKFYVINDTGTELTLIMDGNLGDTVAWDETGLTTQGPLKAIEALKERTNGWTNIPEITYTYSDDSGNNRYSSFSVNMRARILKASEAKSLGCGWNARSCSNYLYTTGSGYWTSSASSAIDNVMNAQCISSDGRLSNVPGMERGSYGIRPVINIKKF